MVEVPGTIAAVAAAVSVVSKELLYRATARVGADLEFRWCLESGSRRVYEAL